MEEHLAKKLRRTNGKLYSRQNLAPCRGVVPSRSSIHLKNIQTSRPGFRKSSLQVKQATVSLGPNDRIIIAGSVTVFQAFSVFTQPIVVQIGDKTVTFKTNRRGAAQTGQSSFRATNASQFGVVYGELMEFKLQFAGEEWSAEIQKLGEKASGPEVNAQLSMKIGKAKDKASAKLRVERN